MPDFVNDYPDGVHHGVPADQYHALPALSSGGLKVLHSESPADFWEQFLNPEHEDDQRTEFDIGTAAHLLVLQPELFDASVVKVPFDSYRSKEAKAQRDAAYAAGKVPLRTQDHAAVLDMREAVAASAHLVQQATGFRLDQGEPEVTYLWIDRATKVRCRARTDWRSPDLRHIIDVKTSGSAKPEVFQARIEDNGYHISEAHYLAGHEALGRVPAKWWWLVIATKPPHCVSLLEADPSWRHIGEDYRRAALELYAECARRNEWPGYLDRPGVAGITERAKYRYEAWKAEHAERRQSRAANDHRAANMNAADRDAMIRWQAPHDKAIGA